MTTISIGLPGAPRAAAPLSADVVSIHSWELVTAVDGPGTRLTVFLSGCPLRCRYCQNPDTWHIEDGTPTSVDDVLALVRRYRHVFDATGGGLTLSGGEPLRQAAAVKRIFTACAAMGVHTALDTSGFLGAAADDELLDATSLVLLDVKSGLPGTYHLVTGGELAPTVAFGDRLSARGNPMWVRFVLVPGLTDAPENVEAVADIVARWTVERVEVLPFHQLGEHKWDDLGLPYTLHGVRPPDQALQDDVRARFRARGLLVY